MIAAMRLYYMTSLETLEQYILPELRIRISTFDAVNDPFELLGTSQNNKVDRRHFASLYKHWVKTLGFVSFSDNWKSPLMWGHYARNHTGVCLGIEVPDDRVLRVQYEPARLNFLLEMSPLEAAVDPDVIKRIVTTKFKEWEYEREWRYITPLEHRDDDTGHYHVYLSPDFELREIIVGARCETSLEEIRKQVFGNTGTITMTKVRAAFGTFSMVKQRMQKMLTISSLHQMNR
jgi:hypothetical protein